MPEWKAEISAHLANLRLTPTGCVAKIDERRQEPGLDFSLGGASEEAVHKSQLSLNGAFAHSVDLAFSDHNHRLESFDRSPRRLETKEAESGIDSP